MRRFARTKLAQWACAEMPKVPRTRRGRLVIKLSDRSPQGDSAKRYTVFGQGDSCAAKGSRPKFTRPKSHSAKLTRTRMLPRVLGQSSFSQGFLVEGHSATVLGRRSLGQAYSAKGHSAKSHSAKLIRTRMLPSGVGQCSVGQSCHSAKSHSAKPIRIRQNSLGRSSFGQTTLGKAHSDSYAAKGSRPKLIQPRVLGRRSLGGPFSVEGHSAKLIRPRSLGQVHSYSAMSTRPK